MHTVLVAEDDALLRHAWRDFLTEKGYAVRSTDNLPDAMALARQEPRPQLALLDLGLPPQAGDASVGLELLRQLLVEIPTLKAIILTGQDEAAVSWRAIALGAFDFVVKPSSRTQIHQSLQRASLFLESERQLGLEGLARVTLTAPLAEGVKEFGEAAQEKLVRGVLNGCDFNVAQAARTLGLSREHLYYFMKKFGVERSPL